MVDTNFFLCIIAGLILFIVIEAVRIIRSNIYRSKPENHIHNWSDWAFDFASGEIHAARICKDSNCSRLDYLEFDK